MKTSKFWDVESRKVLSLQTCKNLILTLAQKESISFAPYDTFPFCCSVYRNPSLSMHRKISCWLDNRSAKIAIPFLWRDATTHGDVHTEKFEWQL